MHTTVIGSYPLKYDELGSNAIEQAVEEQISAGINIISDGQTRADMISMYAGVLNGMEVKNGKMRITEKISTIDVSKFVEDFKLAKDIAGKRAEVKAILTGPLTLASISTLNTLAYKGYWDKKLYKDISSALLNIALELEKAGARHFQIDEPYFSVKMPKEAIEAVENITTQLHEEVTLHVCGDITKIFDDLLKLNGIKILSHAFANNPENLSVISREKLESSGKILGFGCINISSERVEKEEEVLDLVNKSINLVGIENIVIHPDCGMRMLPKEVAKEKLITMCKAVQRIKETK
jgi:5-methyltetrahydropteroyltriglutamate--homocysteine methyltransferase